MYTLQSLINGKYISELFAVGHDEIFQASSRQDAYGWNRIEAIQAIKEELYLCEIVEYEVIEDE